MSVPVTVAGGGEGRAESLAGEQLVCVLPRAYAPGAPMELALAAGEGELALRGKCVGSKRRDDGDFDVRVRLVSLRRAERAALVAALPG